MSNVSSQVFTNVKGVMITGQTNGTAYQKVVISDGSNSVTLLGGGTTPEKSMDMNVQGSSNLSYLFSLTGANTTITMTFSASTDNKTWVDSTANTPVQIPLNDGAIPAYTATADDQFGATDQNDSVIALVAVNALS